MNFNEWLLEIYGIEDFEKYKAEHDYFNTFEKEFFKEYLKTNK